MIQSGIKLQGLKTTMKPLVARTTKSIAGRSQTTSMESTSLDSLLLLKRPFVQQQSSSLLKHNPVDMAATSSTNRSILRTTTASSRIVYHAPIFSKQLPVELRKQIATQLAKEYNIRKIAERKEATAKQKPQASTSTVTTMTTHRNQQIKEPKKEPTSTTTTADKQTQQPPSSTQTPTTSTQVPSNKPLTGQELRAQLHTELANRAKTCAYAAHRCSLPRVNGFPYCMNHILKDTRAPYKQCSFVYTCNGKRCPNAAPRMMSADNTKHNSYCFEHNRLTQRVRSRTVSRWNSTRTLDKTLAQLSHYVTPVDTRPPDTVPVSYQSLQQAIERNKRDGTVKREVVVKTDENGKIVPLDPMTEIDVDTVLRLRNALNFASDSDSDDEPILYKDVNQSSAFLGPDVEDVDDVSPDPLKHAGIYTAQEANTIMRDKLSRLQILYVDQFRVLHQELKMKKQKLAVSYRRELDTLCSVRSQPKDSARELNLYRKLKACQRYKKKSGLEAVLNERSLERRAKQLQGSTQKPHHTGPKCLFAEGGVKCAEKPMPCSKYCRKHILEDKRQILFRPCGVELGGVVCREPITGLLKVDTCPLHYKIPQPRTYNIRKESTDSENSEEEPIAVPENSQPPEGGVGSVPEKTDDNKDTECLLIPKRERIEDIVSPGLSPGSILTPTSDEDFDEEVVDNQGLNVILADETDIVTMDCQEEDVEIDNDDEMCQEEVEIETEEIPMME